MSRGTGSENTGFNVAVSGMTSLDIPRQAQDLVDRMKKKGVRVNKSIENEIWKTSWKNLNI